MKQRIFFITSISLAIIIGFLLLTLGMVVLSHSIITSLESDGSFAWLVDSAVFDEVLINNSTDFMSLVIGLPSSVLISVVALVLAFMSFKTSKKEHERAAHETVSSKLEAVQGEFVQLANALNAITVRGGNVVHEIVELYRDAKLTEEAIVDEFYEREDDIDQDELFQKINSKTQVKWEFLGQVIGDFLNFARESLKGPFLDLYNDPVGREIINNTETHFLEQDDFDPVHYFQNFFWAENRPTNNKNDIELIFSRMRKMLPRDSIYLPFAECDKDTVQTFVVKSAHKDRASLALLVSAMPKVHVFRSPVDSDYQKISEMMTDTDPMEALQFGFDNRWKYLKASYDSLEEEYVTREGYCMAAEAISWLSRLFVSEGEVRERVGRFFDPIIFKRVLKNYIKVVSPQEMLLPAFRLQIEEIEKEKQKRPHSFIEVEGIERSFK